MASEKTLQTPCALLISWIKTKNRRLDEKEIKAIEATIENRKNSSGCGIEKKISTGKMSIWLSALNSGMVIFVD